MGINDSMSDRFFKMFVTVIIVFGFIDIFLITNIIEKVIYITKGVYIYRLELQLISGKQIYMTLSELILIPLLTIKAGIDAWLVKHKNESGGMKLYSWW